MNGDLKATYVAGLAWLDTAAGAGVDFFVLARRMACDGFDTSPVGMRDVYMGNTPQAEFVVPPAAIDYVLRRSPFR